MADYRALRQRYSLLEICRQPELAVAVTLQPVDVIEVDAAILFSDLLVPFTPMGLDFDFIKGEGPSIHNPIRSASDVERLRLFEPRRRSRTCSKPFASCDRELAGRVPLIGFGGAPFTLAAYAIEGGPSTNYARTKAFMYSQPAAWHALCGKFATLMADYLRAQIEAGAQAIQVFDSWAGALSRADYREFALPHSAADFLRAEGHGRAADSFRRRHERDPPRACRSRRGRHRPRLASAARRRLGDDWPRPRGSRQSRTDAAPRPAGSHVRGGRRRAADERADARATSSTSGTGSCRTLPSNMSRRSRGTSILTKSAGRSRGSDRSVP